MPSQESQPTATPNSAKPTKFVESQMAVDANITSKLCVNDGIKKVYLTFDDGPSANTDKILNILAKYKVNATFFVLDNLAKDGTKTIKRMADKGNIVTNHSYSHVYSNIYANETNIINEINQTETIISNIIGQERVQKLFRFPGGSFGEKMAPFRDAVAKNGYKFVDWNALNNDAEKKNVTVSGELASIRNTCSIREDSIILMHDTAAKGVTVKVLPSIIEYLKSKGYIFETINVS